MTSSEIVELPLPATVREGLAHLCNKLQQTLEDRLLSVVLYGGAAKGEHIAETSDVNVAIVLDQVTVNALDSIAPIIQAGVRDFRLAAMLMSESDLKRSTEVFPVKFLDMQRHHRILSGRDVFSDLTVSTDRLRLRCAQEITNLLLRLRQFYVQRRHRPELIESTLTRAISSLLAGLNTLVELRTGRSASDKSSIIEAAAEIGLDAQPLREVFALKRGELKPNPEELRHLYDRFMMTVQQALVLVDKL